MKSGPKKKGPSPPAPAPDTVEGSTVETYRLPFDGRRPILVTGPTWADKVTFVRHLLNHHARTAHVFDAAALDRYQAAKCDVTTFHPDDFETDKDFFVRAAEALSTGLATPGHFIVIAEYHLLTRPYEPSLYEQEVFAYVLAEALAAARTKPGRLVLTSSQAPTRHERDQFGCHFFIGPMMPSDWVMTFNRTAEAITPLNRPGTGVLALEGHFETVEFPLTEPDSTPRPATTRRFSLPRPSRRN